MDAWQPPPLPNNYQYVDDVSIYRTNPYLDRSNSKLLNNVEWVLRPRNNGGIFDELGNFIETGIRKKLRTWSGGDLSEFTIFNRYINTGRRRTDHYFQAVNRIICKDESVRIYLQNLSNLAPVEQVIWVNVLLDAHPEIKKLNKDGHGLTIDFGVLMYRLGLEKFGICEDKSL